MITQRICSYWSSKQAGVEHEEKNETFYEKLLKVK